ncbi:PREDICTED: acidic amino acid decarboxylase GADL1-like [Odobenus rosmarus divergens]|uniref:Acidic amino acid decarboxylase GADL1-like n=1 Tax=Odobenus rosmarus divergens TaxID=9708 RepID=A0A2U3X332_ODORO|nr:PREDICTED: acidic amino acid decarboxylase GADL1-like [Odobenus rosmarus divergens]
MAVDLTTGGNGTSLDVSRKMERSSGDELGMGQVVSTRKAVTTPKKHMFTPQLQYRVARFGKGKYRMLSQDLLKKCYSAKASYLFQQDKFYDVSYDTGDKSIQCSRRPDAFKFWMTWKALGTLGLEERVNRALALSRYLVEEIKKREGFKLLLEPEYANICFWYIPPSLREMEEGPEFWAKLNLVAPTIKERMMKKGSLMLGYQPHRGKVNFFRQVVISPQVSREDMDFLLDEIDLLGRDM